MGNFGKNLVDLTNFLASEVPLIAHKFVRELIDKFWLPIGPIENNIGIGAGQPTVTQKNQNVGQTEHKRIVWLFREDLRENFPQDAHKNGNYTIKLTQIRCYEKIGLLMFIRGILYRDVSTSIVAHALSFSMSTILYRLAHWSKTKSQKDGIC